MQDPSLIHPELQPEYICPECGARLLDEEALNAHRQDEHLDEVEGARRGSARNEAGTASEDYGRDATGPREPAP